MPSSTSSSSVSPISGEWGRTWILAASALVLLLGGAEVFFRARGWVPAVPDPPAWILERARVKRESVVLVGASRMQAGVDPSVWAEVVGGDKPVNLSSFGDSPVSALEDLAADTAFAGSVVCDCTPFVVLNEEWGGGANVIAFRAARTSPAKWTEARLSTWINGNLVVRRSELSLTRGLEMLWERQLPEEIVSLRSRGMRGDRFYPMDFITRTAASRLPGPDFHAPEARTLDGGAERQLRRLERAISAITGRGGRVVVVQFPAGGERRAYELAMFPREIFWAAMETRLGVPTIHYMDRAELTGFDAPDGSHLDRTSTRRFTTALARAVADLWGQPN